ncbi:MAG: leucyl aminopeptidase [Chloroflexota bacterium]
MKIDVHQGGIQTIQADAIIVNLFEGVTHPGGATGIVDQALSGAISEVIASGDLTGKLGETIVLYPRGDIPAKRVIIVGLGASSGFGLEQVREAAAVAIKQAKKIGASNVATIVHGGGIGGLDIQDATQAVTEGTMLALYHYEKPTVKPNPDARKIDAVTVVEFDSAKIDDINAGVQAGQIIAESVYLTRTLVNQPSNAATPTVLAQTAEAIGEQTGLTCRVLEEDDLQAEGMGLFLAVTQGAKQPAKFIIMEHKPAALAETDNQPIVLVGKGVTFDTGGYTLKSSTGMPGMKGDMGGGAAVIGTMRAVALLDLPIHVIGLVPAVENMIGAQAYKPNDVFVAKNGVSVEIISTDAEGRLILADALCYANTLNPALVIDVATLTGGKAVALGPRMTALFCTEDTLFDSLRTASETVSEPVWRMPLDSAYDRQLESDTADIKNTGGRLGSAITAARFLAHFIGNWPWAHLDIAGGEFYNGGRDQTPRGYLTKGATGTPVRTFVEFLRQQS